MGYEMAYFGNALLTLLALGIQLGWFDDFLDDLFSENEEEDPIDDPLYNAGDYNGEIFGTEGNDHIVGAEHGSALAFFLGDGDDSLEATSEADYAEGGPGADVLVLYEGNDIAEGGDGNDAIFAGRGDDAIYGGEGDDRLDGSLGNDKIYGEGGNDVMTGGVGDDVLYGGAGNDTMSGDRLDSFGNTDRGIDILYAGEGDDYLRLVGGDTGVGGGGADVFELHDTGDADHQITIVDFEPGTDSIVVSYEQSFDPVTSDPITPTVDVIESADGADAVITFDGDILAVVTGAAGLQVDDITLEVIA